MKTEEWQRIDRRKGGSGRGSGSNRDKDEEEDDEEVEEGGEGG